MLPALIGRVLTTGSSGNSAEALLCQSTVSGDLGSPGRCMRASKSPGQGHGYYSPAPLTGRAFGPSLNTLLPALLQAQLRGGAEV